MSFHRPFSGIASLAMSAAAALVLLTPASILSARAQAAQQAALSDSAKSDSGDERGVADDRHRQCVATVDQANPPQPKSLTAKAIEKVKEVAKSASDIFSRVPCLPPKGGAKPMGSLPHVAGKLAAGEAGGDRRVRIVLDPGIRRDVTRIHLSEPAGGAIAPAISGRRHHRPQSRQRRRRRARNDEAAAGAK